MNMPNRNLGILVDVCCTSDLPFRVVDPILSGMPHYPLGMGGAG
jgi:hypothetical protein